MNNAPPSNEIRRVARRVFGVFSPEGVLETLCVFNDPRALPPAGAVALDPRYEYTAGHHKRIKGVLVKMDKKDIEEREKHRHHVPADAKAVAKARKNAL